MPALSSIVDIVGGGTPSKQNPAYWGGDIPWVSVKDFKSSRIDGSSEYITSAGVKNSATTIIPKGNLIVPTRMALGKVAVNTVDVAINQDLKALLIRDVKVVDRDYLMRVLESKASEIEKKGKGATVKGITLDVLRDLDIPLPPLETQKQIAAILEKADQLRKDCQQMEQELNNLAQSVFLGMFGDPVSNPKGWQLRPCAAICEDITVGVVVKPASYYAISGVPALRSLNVRENKLSDENLVYFSEEANEKKVPKSRIYEGNVLIVRSGQPGRAAVVTKKYDGCNCIDVLIARPDKTLIEPHFLSFFLNSEGGRRLVLKEERGQIQKHLNVKALNEALIPVPDIKHQNKFVAFLAGNQLRLDECKANLAELDVLYSSLVKKAFNGELKIKNKAA